MIADEAHTALGEKTSAAIRSMPEPIFIGMTATEQLIAKQVSDVFPASVDDLPLADAARRGLIAPLRSLRIPPAAAIHSVPIIGGDFDEGELAKVLDHEALNQAAASMYRDRFDATPGIVYAAGVDHAYNLAKEFRAAGIKAEAVSGRTPPVKLAETLAAYERGEINVLINAMLLAEGWNSPRATVCMHLAPTASKRVYQQRIGRIMRDPSAQGSGHRRRLRSEGRDAQRACRLAALAARRRLLPRRRARHARRRAAGTSDARGGASLRRRGSSRSRPTSGGASRSSSANGSGSTRSISTRTSSASGRRSPGRKMRFDERTEFVRKFTDRGASKGALEQFLATCAAENPNRRLRMIALPDRVSMPVERADFDDLVTLVTQAPTWEKDRLQGIRILLRAIADGHAVAPEQILARWTWKLARASRKVQDRRASAEFPEAKRLLGALANSRGHRHEENAARLVNTARDQPLAVGAALLASSGGLHPAREPAARRSARATRDGRGDRRRARRQPAAAQAAADAPPPPQAQAHRQAHRVAERRAENRRGDRERLRRRVASTEAPTQAPPQALRCRERRGCGCLRGADADADAAAGS